ncbi:TetR/AcrR family transcriptional regulator [Spirosoma fluviale]|uniref:Transcriptional regulator, TetR family n=1 Tax=Spirosoma fluviale TaxID=1597977 RepID=A0A286FBK2_9BACT|nr:TetR/AcrR family transcriptional regulator [Spirosoma fluviale]SOD80369.1 transcriptional regulator, TetR family [Spirosoma fluviale]
MKEKIIISALEQFLRFGVRKVTIQQIIYPLGLSTHAVYKYFASKEDLVEACLLVQYERLFQQYQEIEGRVTNPVLLLFQLYQKLMSLDFAINPVFYSDLNRYYPELQDKVLDNEIKRFGPFFFKIIEAGKKQGYIQANVPTEIFAVALNAVYRLLTRSNTYELFESSPFELANHTVGLYIRGACTEKGIREIEINKSLTLFEKPRA